MDASVVEFQRACDTHTALWAKVDDLTPKRDEWHAKWVECEAMAHKELSLETSMEQAAGKAKRPSSCAHCVNFLPSSHIHREITEPTLCPTRMFAVIISMRKPESFGRRRSG